MWLIFLIALGAGDHKLKKMGNFGSKFVKEYHFRRFLTAAYWSVHCLLCWLSQEVIRSLPKPEDNTVYLVVDGSKKEKRGSKNPYSQKGKSHTHSKWFFGIKFVVLMLQWNNFRIPIDFEIVYPKKHAEYENENKLFRKMLLRFYPCTWMKRIIVLGDSGFASKDNLKYIVKRAKKERKRITWGFLFSFPKTWKTKNNQKLKDIAKHTPKTFYKRKTIQSISSNRSKTFWVFSKKTALEHVGDVTIVFSRKRRNTGPKGTKVIVTNLVDLTQKQIMDIFQRRFMIEVLFRELKSGMGLGKHQVTNNEERIKKSMAVPILSYLLILKLHYKSIKPNQSWSIFKLQEEFRYKAISSQANHDRELLLKKIQRAA